MNRRAMMKPYRIFVLGLFWALAACQSPTAAPLLAKGTDLTGSAIGGPFSLINKDGKPVSWDQFKGKYRIVYFGYTYCPDACPLDLGIVMQGYLRFAKDHAALAADVQPIFITIDPARDTPRNVGTFTSAFSPKLLGLTGTQAEIDAVAKLFKVSALRGETTPGGYLMNHSRFAYLMDRAGQPIEVLPADQGPEAVAADLAALVH